MRLAQLHLSGATTEDAQQSLKAAPARTLAVLKRILPASWLDALLADR